jgi:glycosyltransferase involved in cell wall biosynthesis
MKRFSWLLTENGYSVALICRHRGGLDENEFPAQIKFYQLSSTSFLKKMKEILSCINDFNPDIVHTHYLVKDCLIPALKFGRKYKYYISIWGSDINIFSSNLLNRISQNIGLLLCDKFHLLSPYFEQKIMRQYFFLKNSDYSVFSWGIDYGYLSTPDKGEMVKLKEELHIKGDTLIILSYRNHMKLYNHHTLVKSIPYITKEYPNTKFIFTRGSYNKDYKEKTYQLVNELNIGQNFILLDRWLTDEELRALINIADITLSIPDRDGLPATLFEIMSTKAIPVVSNLINYHPFFTDKINGFYLKNPKDHQELSSILMTILSDLKNYQETFYPVNTAYIKAEQNWQKQSKLFLDFYK